MKLAGNLDLLELAPIDGYDPNRGTFRTRRFTGLAALVELKRQSLRTAKTAYQIERPNGENPIISATYSGEDAPTNTPLTDRWFMVTNDLEKDIWEHPVIVAEIQKTLIDPVRAYAGAQAIRDIKSMIAGQTVEQDGRVITMPEAIGVCVTVGMSQSVVTNFVYDLMKGVKTFTIDQYVLRRVQTAPENTTIRVGETTPNIGRIFRKATLNGTTEGAPLRVPGFGLLPEGYYLKRRPLAEPPSSGDIWTITQEYWHADAYSTLLYGLPL